MSGIPTSWSVIEGAAGGDTADRATFARVYLPVVRSYLRARWRTSGMLGEVEDAVQDVFLDCLREDGALTRADRNEPQSFRSFLYGVTRNVARSHERRAARPDLPGGPSGDGLHDHPEGPDSGLARVFDRAMASSLLAEALRLMIRSAAEKGPEARRRVELLRERIYEGQAIREIAARHGEDPTLLHRQYATAREEYRRELERVLREHRASVGGLTEEGLLELFEAAG